VLRYSLVIVIASLLQTACTNAFFQPLKAHIASPEQYNIEYEDIYFAGQSGGKLHGWWFPSVSDSESKAHVLFLHGNGENISTHSGLVYWLTQHQYDVFIFDYRGYGKSQGKAEIEGVMSDIQSSRLYIESRRDDNKKVFIIGHSLGASMGIYNLAHYPQNIDGLILVSPFSDYRQITRETMDKSWLTWLFQWPASLMISAEYNPIDYVSRLPEVPKLFLYSEKDRIISSDHIIKLYDEASELKYIKKVQGYHNSVFAEKENQQIIVKYLDKWSEINVSDD